MPKKNKYESVPCGNMDCCFRNLCYEYPEDIEKCAKYIVPTIDLKKEKKIQAAIKLLEENGYTVNKIKED